MVEMDVARPSPTRGDLIMSVPSATGDTDFYTARVRTRATTIFPNYKQRTWYAFSGSEKHVYQLFAIGQYSKIPVRLCINPFSSTRGHPPGWSKMGCTQSPTYVRRGRKNTRSNHPKRLFEVPSRLLRHCFSIE